MGLWCGGHLGSAGPRVSEGGKGKESSWAGNKAWKAGHLAGLLCEAVCFQVGFTEYNLSTAKCTFSMSRSVHVDP